MHTLSDDDRMSTQLEGKKLKGFGARFGKIFGQIIENTVGLGSGMELDDERGIHSEEIIFDEKGQEVEERKKREAMRQAVKMQQQGQRVNAIKKSRIGKENKIGERGEEREIVRERSPQREIEEIRETSKVRGEALTQQKMQLDIAKGRDPALTESQQIREGNLVKETALKAHIPTPRGNDMAIEKVLLGEGAKHLDRSQDALADAAKQKSSPAHGMLDLVKAVLPVHVPDQREKSHTHGGPVI